MGWDKESNFPKDEHILRYVKLSMIQNDKCERLLQVSGPGFRLHESFNCAGYDDVFGTINWNCFLNIFFVYRDSEDLSDPDCTGYGGGPLVCARKDDSSR